MFLFICPVCKRPLSRENGTLQCENRHCYDLSRQGVVNLLMSQKSAAKRHGDDKLMVRARKEFLDGGFYLPLLKKVEEAAIRHAPQEVTLLDVGCGECWYTTHIYNALKENGKTVNAGGVDISKEALFAGARRCEEVSLAVASAANLPVGDGGCDMLLNLFAPYHKNEFLRVLRDGGILIRAAVLEKHLWELKQAVYDRPYENQPESTQLEGFRLLSYDEVKGEIHLTDSAQIDALFKMTPYYYKTGVKDQEKLARLTTLTTRTEFAVTVYQKE